MLLLMIFAFAHEQPEVPMCIVDQCDKEVCVIETPEGWVEVDRRPDYYEGKLLMKDECPITSIEPT